MTMTVSSPRAKGHPGYSESHPRAEQTASLARGLVRTACATWGLPDEAAEAASLVMTELLSNAVRHASGPSVRVIVDRPSDDRVYVAVVDRSPHRLPELRPLNLEEPCGRGLVLVEGMSDQWGITLLGSHPTRGPWGKETWAVVKVGSP